MLFKRRHEVGLLERLRTWLWPRASWRRSGRYYGKRLLRLSGTPYALATGCAAGAAVCFTPFIGFHFLLAFALALALRGNLVAAAIGTAVGNPLTFPLIWAATYETGYLILRGVFRDAPDRLSYDLGHKSLEQLWPLLQPMLLGSIPLGMLAGCIVYVVVHKVVASYQSERRERFAGRRALTTGAPVASPPVRSGSPI